MEQEGVIKYSLSHETTRGEDYEEITLLNLWRQVLRSLGLIGQDPNRYDGLGFGNMSARIEGEAFVITGSQTGEIPTLSKDHYAEVTFVDVEENRVRSRGPVEPSSECLTHAAVYQALPTAQFVFHCHSPEIWNNREALELMATDAECAYGTPAMARAVAGLVREPKVQEKGVFVMGGHEDGIVAFGHTAVDTGSRLEHIFARASHQA